MSRRLPANFTLFAVLAGGGAILDLTSKWIVFSTVGVPQPNSQAPSLRLWPEVFSLTTSFNKGALWGIGGSFSFANRLFACLSIAAAVLIGRRAERPDPARMPDAAPRAAPEACR